MRSVFARHFNVGGEPLPRVVSSISCRARASKTTHAATVRGEAARVLKGCLWAEGPGFAGGLAASSRPGCPTQGCH